MIDKTFQFILDELNGYLALRYPSSEAHAVLSSPSNQDGTLPAQIENKLVLTLANVEREPAASGSAMQLRPHNGEYVRVSPALKLNVYVLMSAYFGNNYGEALKFLSSAMGFFQGKPMYSREDAPDFPRGLERLSLEMVNLSLQDLNNLWGNLGGKYLPSVMYKARMLTIQEDWITERVPEITGTETTL